MKNTSINLIGCQLFLISILAILPVGCASETEEQQQPVLDPKSEITEEDKDSKLTPKNRDDRSAAIEEIALEKSAKFIESENIVYFDFDCADLNEEAKAKLKQISQKLVNSDRKIEIAGYTDKRGSYEYNLKLATRRAEAVKEFLESLGVDSARLSIVSYGETKSSPEGSNAQNRRVEITIVEPSQ
ncbi:MAG: OmpA family protein [Prochloraceae cyanobacterium]|nr:OmpA family protein [Prochloraceae cyanobacterium]